LRAPAPFIAAIARWLSPAAVAALTILSLVPGEDRPHTGVSGNLEHLAAYAITAGLIATGFPAWPVAWILAGLSAASATFEVLQIWIPGRSPTAENWAASSAGALLGAAGARLLCRLLQARGA
jgi:hypothetical protein